MPLLRVARDLLDVKVESGGAALVPCMWSASAFDLARFSGARGIEQGASRSFFCPFE
jgi:hypothetical protein